MILFYFSCKRESSSMFVKLLDYRITVEWIHLFECTWLELHIETIFFCSENLLPVFFIEALSHASVWNERHSIHLWNRPRSSHWRRWDEQQCCLFLSHTSITTWLVVHLASALAIHPFQGTRLSSEVYYSPIYTHLGIIKHSVKTCSKMSWGLKLRFCHLN